MRFCNHLRALTTSVMLAFNMAAGETLSNLSIAIISDVHVHDVYADLGEINKYFMTNPKNG